MNITIPAPPDTPAKVIEGCLIIIYTSIIKYANKNAFFLITFDYNNDLFA